MSRAGSAPGTRDATPDSRRRRDTDPAGASSAHGARAGRATTAVVAASAVAGLAAYAFQVLGTRSLGGEDYAPVGVLWTLQFLLFSVLLHPFETWVARVVVEQGRPPSRRPLTTGVLGVLAVIGVLSLALFSARGAVFDPSPPVALVVPLVGVAYLATSLVRGVLAGRGRYSAYAAVTAGESVVRLLCGGVVVLVGPTALGLALVLPVGALLAAWAGLVLARRAGADNGPAGPAGPVDDGGAGRFLLPVAAANVAAQVLLAGGPLLLAATGSPPAVVTVSFVLLTLARAPLVFGYGGLLSRVLPPLVRMVADGDEAGLRRAVLLMASGSAILALIGAAVARLVAAPVAEAVFGLASPGSFAALAVGGCLVAAGNLLLGQVLVARRWEWLLAGPWWAGLATGVAVVLVVPGDPLLLSGAGLLVGEVVAAVGLLGLLLRRRNPTGADAHRT